MATLHYVNDPLCGWCWGATPLLDAASRVAGLAIALHEGGLFAGPARRPFDASMRAMVRQHDPEVERLTGQPFGEAYRSVLLNDDGAVLDSEPPIAAVLAAGALGASELAMFRTVQAAHFMDGRRIAEPAVLVDVATKLGLDPGAFEAELAKQMGEPTRAHIGASRALLGKLGGRGFPMFGLEQDGRLEALAHPTYFRGEARWQAMLAEKVR